jgi:hypothetical protein
MSDMPLGRLERVQLRDVWQSEPQGFTPWLAKPENLKLLGDTIGIDLELEAQEKEVGPFRADILCKDTAGTGGEKTWVLIENQLEPTDHKHLGQLMTYAAGLKAVTIIWIAERFTEDHRAALDWLNEITDDRFTFFGLEIELWKIVGCSAIAPKFNIVCKPNDWSKRVAEGATQIEKGELTDARRLQLDFWTAFREYVLARTTTLKPYKPAPQHWQTFPIGRGGFRMHAIASLRDSVSEKFDAQELRAELALDSADSKRQFQILEKDKATIEKEMGEPLVWYSTDARQRRIYVRRPAELEDRKKWPEYHEWLLKKLETFHKVFAGRIRELPGSGDDDENGDGPRPGAGAAP